MSLDPVMLVISATKALGLLTQLTTSLEGYAPEAIIVLLEHMIQRNVLREPTPILHPIKI